MIEVRAFGRLHFGLLNPSGPGAERRFGGIGLMIRAPELLLRVEPASAWYAEGPLAERALAFAHRFADATRREEAGAALPPRRLRLERVMPAHAGLGSGTQLGLSVARALAASWELPGDTATLARRVERGLRSAVGAHGFEHGGFLVESGKRSAAGLAPLVARYPFPEAWRLVVALPASNPPRNEQAMLSPHSSLLTPHSSLLTPHSSLGVAGLHGRDEEEAFAQLRADAADVARTGTLCRLVLLGLLPALLERDLEAFAEALYEFNVQVGEAFAPVQGGVYASPRVAEMIAFLRGQQVRGVGQSSWGPAAFAVVADADHAEQLAAQLRRRFALPQDAVWTTPACNHGATLKQED